MPCAVINVLHPMVGVDIHAELTPPGAPPIPVPMPFVPHAVFAPLGNAPGLLMGTVKRTDTSQGKKAVLVNFVRMPIIIQGSDIGPIIPHIPLIPCTPIPNLPLIILGSGSASEFFAFSVKAHGKAIANAPFVFLAMNMNCGFPPTPGNVIAPSLVFTGFRIGDFTYITDANHIDREEMEKLKGTKVLIINALRFQKHISHFSVSEAIRVSEEIGATTTYFTHISHQLGLHNTVEQQLPHGFHLAYDGLVINI